MKIGIDSYSYHRYFGEVYPRIQKRPRRKRDVWWFLDRAAELGVAGVSLESCFLEPLTDRKLQRLRRRLDELELERVWAWGHPTGLKSGTDRAALEDLIRHIGIARSLGANVMRIVGGSRFTTPPSWSQHKRKLTAALRRAAKAAEAAGVVLALENHIDLTADQMLEVLDAVNSPFLGVCLDTANNIRMFEDPIEVVRKLAPHTRATHLKDVKPWRGSPREFSFWASVPLGQGIIGIDEVIRLLRRAKYRGLLAIEIDFLHPDYGDEDDAVAQSVAYLRSLLGKTG